MIYLDYSATTPVNLEVLTSFEKVAKDYIGNPNSLHKLGSDSYELMNRAIEQMASLLNVKSNELIFTSGATEANNLAIKGICYKYQNRGKHIITTKLEHSSVSEVMHYLSNRGFEISYVNLLDNGLVDIEHLKSLIRDDTILVSICHVNSEVGIVQPINEIGKALKKYSKLFFHVDGTQAVGKIPVDLTNIDLYSFSSHKIYGLKGVGCLFKQASIDLEPLLHGGKSQSIYRAGTPSLALIVSFSKALRLSLENLDEKYEHIKKLNDLIRNELSKYEHIKINSNEHCLPHILNISYVGINSETFMHALEQHGIYVSSQTACSNLDGPSKTIMALYNDKKRAVSSIRISLSHLTTEEEINLFLKCFDVEYEALSAVLGE
jgi:cysteine desulfurase